MMWDLAYTEPQRGSQELDNEIYSLLKELIGGLEDFDNCVSPDYQYSRKIEDTFQLVDQIGVGVDYGFSLFKYPALSSAGFGYVAVFAKSLRPCSIEIVTIGDPERVHHAHSNDPAYAIASAAVKALRKEVERKNNGK